MNHKSRAAFRTVWAAVLGAFSAVGAAEDIVVNPGDDLAGAIQNAPDGSTVRLGNVGVYSLTAPIVLDKDIALDGDVITSGPLPTDFVVRFGGGPTGGNAVRNGDFELGSSDWTVTGAPVNNVITQDGNPQGGSWHAWLRPGTGPVLPDNEQELRLANPVNYGNIPAVLDQRVDLSMPAPGAPAQLLYELRQPLNLPPVPPINTQRVVLNAVPVTLAAPYLHLWIQAKDVNPGDVIEIFVDDESGAPVGVLDTADLSVNMGSMRIYGFSLSTYLGVHNIIIRANLAAGSAPANPSLCLLAAAEMRSDLLPRDPFVPPLAPLDPLTFTYIPDPAVQAWFLSAGVTQPPLSFSVSLGLPGITTIIPLGGFGNPRLNMKISVPQKNPDTMSVDTLDVRVYDELGTLASLRIFPADDPLFAAPTSCIPVQLSFPPVSVKELSIACRISRPTDPVTPLDTQFVLDDLQVTPLHPMILTFYAVNLLQNPSFEFGPVDWALTTPEFGAPPLTFADLISTDSADQCDGTQCVRFRYPNTFTAKLFAWIKIPQWNGSGDYFQIQANGSPVFSINDLNFGAYATGDWVKITAPLPSSDPIALSFEAHTATRTATPSIILVGAAEVNTVDPGAEPVNLAPLAIGSEVPVPGLSASLPPVKQTSTALAYRGNDALLFGGIGFPTVSFKVSAPQRSGNGFDALSLLINNYVLWGAMESDTAFSATCAPVETLPYDPGTTIDLSVRASIADNSSDPTMFVLDDLCVTPVCALVKTLDPSIDPCAWSLVPSFDDSSAWTSVGPAGPLSASIIRSTADACSPDKAAVFTPLSASDRKAVITLAQSGITLPSGSAELSFHLEAEGDVSDRLVCSLNGQPLAPVFSAADTTLATNPNVVLTIPNINGTVTLEFKALISPAPTGSPGFKIDNVAIRQVSSGPLFILNGEAQLTVRGISFENGNPAFSLRDKSRLCMTRCLVRAYSGPGIILNNESEADLVCSVVDGNGGIRNDGTERMMLFQCTILGAPPTGTGPIDAVASILMGGISASSPRVILSYVSGSAYPSPDSDFPNLDSNSFSVSFVNSPWPGKLADTTENLGLRNIKTVSELPSWALPKCGSSGQDFEGQFRSSSDGLMAGADELGGGTGGDLPRWVSCEVSPDPAGKNRTVNIRVETLNIDLTQGAIVLVPEEPVAGVPGSVDNPAHIVEFPLSGNASENTASISIPFSDPFQYRSSLNTPVCTDGRNLIYLRDSSGTLYGLGRNESSIEPQVRTRWSFLVDTLPPELVVLPGSGNGQAGSPRVSGSTDNVLAVGGPGGWPPLSLVMPASYGIIDTVGSQATPDTRAKDRHVFLNAPAGQPLEVAVEARFTDPRPRNNLGQVFNLLTVSGFGTAGAELADVPLNSYVEHATDAARARLTSVSTGTATTYRVTPGSVTGESVTVSWNCVFDETEGLKLAAQPQVKDRAGNESKQPAYALKIWWLQNAQAAFSVGPQGVVVRSPRFEWRMNRPFNFAADEIFPCYPIARYKLWASVDAGLPAAQTRWDALSDWSPWTSGPIELDASELDRLRNDPNLQGRMILICIAGGDEAGNLQPGGAADGAQLTSLADLEASGIDYRWWINGDARMQMSIDTDAQVSLMWRPAGQGTAPVRTFGAARKIPAPKPDLGLVPDADITLRALLPSRAANVDATAAPSQTVIYWTLFRNGRPIKADTALYTDTATPDANGVITFRLSEALQALFDGGLAIADPNAVLNVGNREVRFAITAFAESLIPDATGGLVSVKDATPVTVEFSIYPPEMYEGIRDERPTRIYNRQQ